MLGGRVARRTKRHASGVASTRPQATTRTHCVGKAHAAIVRKELPWATEAALRRAHLDLPRARGRARQLHSELASRRFTWRHRARRESSAVGAGAVARGNVSGRSRGPRFWKVGQRHALLEREGEGGEVLGLLELLCTGEPPSNVFIQ